MAVCYTVQSADAGCYCSYVTAYRTLKIKAVGLFCVAESFYITVSVRFTATGADVRCIASDGTSRICNGGRINMPGGEGQCIRISIFTHAADVFGEAADFTARLGNKMLILMSRRGDLITDIAVRASRANVFGIAALGTIRYYGSALVAVSCGRYRGRGAVTADGAGGCLRSGCGTRGSSNDLGCIFVAGSSCCIAGIGMRADSARVGCVACRGAGRSGDRALIAVIRFSDRLGIAVITPAAGIYFHAGS